MSSSKPLNPRIQLVYSPHSSLDAEYQDAVFDGLFPDFFEQDGLNVLGLEQAGDMIDAQRDRIFSLLQADRQKSFVMAAHEVMLPSMVFASESQLTASYLSALYGHFSADHMMNRRNALLDVWNTDHPGARVLPYFESFASREESTRIGGDVEQNGSRGFDLSKLTWREFASVARRQHTKRAVYHGEREANWVRIISDLVQRAELVRTTRLNFMLIIGTDHDPITGLLEERLRDRAEILPPHYIPGRDSSRLLSVQPGLDDETLFRRQMLQSFSVKQLQKAARQKPYTLFRMEPQFADALRSFVSEHEPEELAMALGFKPIPDSGSPLRLPEQLSETSHAFVSLDNTPQTNKLDQRLLASSVCAQLGINHLDDLKAAFVFELVQTIEPSELHAYRKDCIEVSSGGLSAGLLTGLIHRIADVKNPAEPVLWTIRGKKEKKQRQLIASRSLVNAARDYVRSRG